MARLEVSRVDAPCVWYARDVAVIIYGIRNYGRVEDHGGEYATTRFFHLWFAPLIPTGSSWITGRGPGGEVGHSIKLHGKSVAAGYLRVWGAVAALANTVAGLQTAHLGHFIAAAIAGALCAWSWSWRRVRTDAARRRSDFNFVAFGTRCEPRRMPRELRADAKRDLDRRWDARKPDLTPNDVARHGARDPGEAVIAYGLLRLAAVERGKVGASEDTDADRILDGAHVPTDLGDGPYRATPAGTADVPTAATLGDLVAARAAEQVAANPAIVPTPVDIARATKKRVRNQRLGLVCLTLVGTAGLAMFKNAMRPTLSPTLAQLRSSNPPLGRIVKITCDAVHGPLWEETEKKKGGSERVTSRVSMCALGSYFVPVRVDDDDPDPTTEIEGKLYWIVDREIWVRDGLRKEPDLDARSLDVYVDSKNVGEDRVAAYIGFAFTLATPVAWVLYFRSRRRAKRAAAKLATSS